MAAVEKQAEDKVMSVEHEACKVRDHAATSICVVEKNATSARNFAVTRASEEAVAVSGRAMEPGEGRVAAGEHSVMEALAAEYALGAGVAAFEHMLAEPRECVEGSETATAMAATARCAGREAVRTSVPRPVLGVLHKPRRRRSGSAAAAALPMWLHLDSYSTREGMSTRHKPPCAFAFGGAIVPVDTCPIADLVASKGQQVPMAECLATESAMRAPQERVPAEAAYAKAQALREEAWAADARAAEEAVGVVAVAAGTNAATAAVKVEEEVRRGAAAAEASAMQEVATNSAVAVEARRRTTAAEARAADIERRLGLAEVAAAETKSVLVAPRGAGRGMRMEAVEVHESPPPCYDEMAAEWARRSAGAAHTARLVCKDAERAVEEARTALARQVAVSEATIRAAEDAALSLPDLVFPSAAAAVGEYAPASIWGRAVQARAEPNGVCMMRSAHGKVITCVDEGRAAVAESRMQARGLIKSAEVHVEAAERASGAAKLEWERRLEASMAAARAAEKQALNECAALSRRASAAEAQAEVFAAVARDAEELRVARQEHTVDRGQDGGDTASPSSFVRLRIGHAAEMVREGGELMQAAECLGAADKDSSGGANRTFSEARLRGCVAAGKEPPQGEKRLYGRIYAGTLEKGNMLRPMAAAWLKRELATVIEEGEEGKEDEEAEVDGDAYAPPMGSESREVPTGGTASRLSPKVEAPEVSGLMRELFALARVQRSVIESTVLALGKVERRREADRCWTDIEECMREGRALAARLARLRADAGGVAGPKEVARDLRAMAGVWCQRKRQCTSLLRGLQEVKHATERQLVERYAVATDEACGVEPLDEGALVMGSIAGGCAAAMLL